MLDGDELHALLRLVDAEQSRADVLMNIVIPIGAALAYETEWARLLERIVVDAMNLCTADGGVLYLAEAGLPATLVPVIVRVKSLGIAVGGVSRPPVPELCQPACANSSVVDAATRGVSINLPESYDRTSRKAICEETARFDDLTDYRTRSCLSVPLRSAEGKVSGVLRLFNAKRPGDLEISPFEPAMQQVIESLCLLAAAAVESYVRQQRLKDHVHELTIRIDETRKGKQVSAITQSEYFRTLQQRARALRATGAVDTDGKA